VLGGLQQLWSDGQTKVVLTVKYVESFKYLGVQPTSNPSDSTGTDAKLLRGRDIFKSLSEVFCSTTLPVKLHMKLLQTLIMPTVLHGCECWMLSRALCDKLNVFQMCCLRTILHVRWQDHMTNEAVCEWCQVSVTGSTSADKKTWLDRSCTMLRRPHRAQCVILKCRCQVAWSSTHVSS